MTIRSPIIVTGRSLVKSIRSFDLEIAFYKTLTGLPCLPGSKSLASGYVDAKNRQRVLGGLTVKIQADKMALFRNGTYMGNQVCLIC